MLRSVIFAAAPLLWLCAAYAQSPQQIEFFEKNIRPVLAEKCYACHSAGTMAMGGLRLDSKAAARKGGSRGAALVPSDPDGSLLIRAVRYRSLDLRMPPTGKLADDEIADLEAWVRMGAPDPRTGERPPQAPQEKIDVESGRGFWSFQPVRDPQAPAAPAAARAPSDIDRFILAKLEAERLRPAAEADRRTLLRRVTFDLIGLPPTPEEIDAFLTDTSPRAYEKVVERLLASPHYGERWGRHWLDLARWAETNGHEFDNNKLDAWRYRDYVIDAFNSDLPYNQFLKEQIAGDLLPQRLAADGTHVVNPIASGIFWLWEVLNSPTDSVKARADRIDNQIDVISKTAQGLTVACARCHDHKFDPIPTADYYSLFGIFQSTHMSERCIDSPRRAARIQDADRTIGDIQKDVRSHLQPALKRLAATVAARYMAAAPRIAPRDAESRARVGACPVPPAAEPEVKDEEPRAPVVARSRQPAKEPKDASEDPGGIAAELHYALTEPSNPLFPFARMAEPGADDFAGRLDRMRREMRDWTAKADRNHPLWAERGDVIYEDFESGYAKWQVSGAAFGAEPARIVPPNLNLAGHAGHALASSFGNGADSLVGTLTTGNFRMPARFVHVRMAGAQYPPEDKENAKIRFTVVADEHKSGHMMADGSGRLKWKSIAMTKERGRICYLEIIDRDRRGSLAVDRIVFSKSCAPPPIAGKPDERISAFLERGGVQSLEDLARAYQRLAENLAAEKNRAPADEALLAALLGLRRLEDAAAALDDPETRRLEELFSYRDRAANDIPPSAFAMTSMDYEPADSPIHIRGNHKNPGAIAPRRFLQIVADGDRKPFVNGSGRLELAERIASDKNPLTARVMVNRIWKHHFGKGIVATPDNFGKTGARPTHPDLLDRLATRFMNSGWSIKYLQRTIVLSSAYRRSSAASAEARERDPANQWLSYMPVRRLEAEAIRDAVLAVAGALNRKIGGPSVLPHISEFQDGRGKPEPGGPLDGMGRRSVYIQVRRNFLTPLLLAFDYPLPISTIGRRGVSAVPSQALMLLNNEFVNMQAARWAQREIETHGRAKARIGDMYVRAFGREPLEEEVTRIRRFLAKQRRARGVSGDDPRVWTDLAHALLNTSEFIFIR